MFDIPGSRWMEIVMASAAAIMALPFYVLALTGRLDD